MTTITVPRAVLEQALEALEATHYDIGSAERQRLEAMDAITALRAALAQQEQEQEPVAWMLTDDSGMRFVSVDRPHPDFVPLYTHPPRREWQLLSEEEIEDMSLSGTNSELRSRQFARAVEAALKEKNQ